MATKEERRAAARDRAKKYRARKLVRDDPAAAEEQKRQQEAAEAQATQEAAAKAESDKKAAEEQAAKEAALDQQIHVALAGSAELLATMYRVSIDAPPNTPSLGAERCETFATLWTPVLAPLLRKYAGSLAPLIAATGTLGIAMEYREECQRHIARTKPRIVDAEFDEVNSAAA